MVKTLTEPDLNLTTNLTTTDLPVQEIVSINSSGKVIREACIHALIPGLDASFCKTCRIWWVDQNMRDILRPPRKKTAAQSTNE